jgi:hypothetical protein
MAQRQRGPGNDPWLDDERLQGVKYLARLQPLLERLHKAGTARDRAGNRHLFFDQLCSLVLLTFFNPSVQTLGDLQRASRLPQVRKKLGCRQTSSGSLSEALHLFEPELLAEIVQELLAQVPTARAADPRLKELGRIVTAVDGTLLRALPQITQACFPTSRDQGWRLHTQFEVLRGVPVQATVTDASGRGAASEKAVLRSQLAAGRCYVMDRGYEQFALFNAIVAAESDYVCRVRGDHAFAVERTNELSSAASAAGIVADSIGRLGSPKSQRIELPDHAVRRVVVRCAASSSRGARRRQEPPTELVLATNLLDAPAEVIALLYRHRWLIELFFRWLKCVLNCRHLISRDAGGIQIQMYCALIACLLIQLACPFPPQKWTYKLLCLYFQGWATEEDVLTHLQERASAAEKKQA